MNMPGRQRPHALILHHIAAFSSSCETQPTVYFLSIHQTLAPLLCEADRLCNILGTLSACPHPLPPSTHDDQRVRVLIETALHGHLKNPVMIHKS